MLWGNLVSPTFSSVVVSKGSWSQVQVNGENVTGDELASPATCLTAQQQWSSQREVEEENKTKNLSNNSKDLGLVALVLVGSL